jgi:hypothetical protein
LIKKETTIKDIKFVRIQGGWRRAEK